ncbi:MAG: hypothetical protein V3T07_08585 [Myxococcota bacterium]
MRCTRPRRRAGFSLTELAVVLAVTVLLIGLLLPAMSQVRDNLHRIVCSSNLRQLGFSTVMYADDYRDCLPFSNLLRAGLPQELMAVHRGDKPQAWDGLGLLYAMHYCDAPDVYYCPSHTGEHRIERYRDDWLHPGQERIYSNYQYLGDMDWRSDRGRLRRLDDHLLVIATDGLRTFGDFNHRTGLNLLAGDGSVRWRDDRAIARKLPVVPLAGGEGAGDLYEDLWESIEELNR